MHCACKCQGLSTLSWSSTADDDEGAVRPQADEDGARMATAGSFICWFNYLPLLYLEIFEIRRFSLF